MEKEKKKRIHFRFVIQKVRTHFRKGDNQKVIEL